MFALIIASTAVALFMAFAALRKEASDFILKPPKVKWVLDEAVGEMPVPGIL